MHRYTRKTRQIPARRRQPRPGPRPAPLAALAVATAATAAVALAACGGPSVAGTTPAAPPTPAATATGAAGPSMPAMSMPATTAPSAPAGYPSAGTAAGTTVRVGIQNFAFSPATVSVKAGGTVTWTNMDTDPHTVTARDKSFSSPPLRTGQSFSHTFTTPGRYAYLCTIHPFMTALVDVTP